MSGSNTHDGDLSGPANNSVVIDGQLTPTQSAHITQDTGVSDIFFVKPDRDLYTVKPGRQVG